MVSATPMVRRQAAPAPAWGGRLPSAKERERIDELGKRRTGIETNTPRPRKARVS